MAASTGTQRTLSKAFGALKDTTKAGLAKVNSENKVILQLEAYFISLVSSVSIFFFLDFNSA